MPAGRRRGDLLRAGSALVAGTCIAWAGCSQRSLLQIGEMCSSSRGIRSDVPCADGMLLAGLGLPVMALVVLVASAQAVLREIPAPAVPAWAALFTTLGVNCLDFGLLGPRATTSVVWGVIFLVLSAPAWWAMGRTVRKGRSATTWLGSYVALGAVGWAIGWATFGPLT